jgi:SPP1 family predicted phage head-tail adaptor
MIQWDEFRHRIMVFIYTEGQNSIGQVIKNKVHYKDFYCSKYDWQNREQYENKQLVESDIVVFRTYYDSALDTRYTIEFEGREYNIKGVKEIGYKAGLEITAQYKDNR